MADPDIAELLAQEDRLQFDRFGPDTALELGMVLVERARADGLAITIDIAFGEQQLFHAALPGTSADNDAWVQRKNRVVRRFGHSSYLLGCQARARGVDFNTKFLLDPAQYGAHGGAFPIILRGSGVVGTVTVSGLPQAEDHALVVEVLEAFLGRG